MKEIWRNLDGLPKNIELWSYVVNFEFSRPKSSNNPVNLFFIFYNFISAGSELISLGTYQRNGLFKFIKSNKIHVVYVTGVCIQAAQASKCDNMSYCI